MPKETKRFAVGLRTTPQVRDKLLAAVAESGRSIAQEAEHRVEMSFLREEEIYGSPATEALLKTLAMTIQVIEADSGKRWTDDGDTAAEMVAAVQRVIEVLAIVPPQLLREKLARQGDERFANRLRMALTLFGLSGQEIADAYAKGAGKPSTPKKGK